MKRIFYSLLFCVLILSTAPAAHAQSQSVLGVSPVIINVSLSPGKEYNYSVTISNMSSAPLPVKLSFDTFTTDESGDSFTFSEPSDNSILKWASVEPSDLIIPAKSKKIVSLKVALPNKIPLGGYYGVMFVEPVLSKASNSSQVSAKVGVLMLANIGVSQKKNTIDLVNSTFDKTIYSEGPVHHLLRIKNNGLAHFSVKPEMTVESLFDSKKVIPLEEKIIFPGKIRRWETAFELPDYYQGFYRTTIKISTGNGDQQVFSSYILAFPVLPAIMIIVIVSILIFSITKKDRVKKAFKELFSPTR